MAVISPVPGSDVSKAAVVCLADFLDAADPAMAMLASADRGGCLAQWVFTFSVQDILAGAGLEAAVPVGWWFLARDESGHAAASYVSLYLPGFPPALTEVAQGAEIATAYRAAFEMDRWPQVKEKDYQLRVLRIPGLLIEAFWLKAMEPGESDFMVPFLGIEKRITLMQPIAAGAFLDILRPLAALPMN